LVLAQELEADRQAAGAAETRPQRRPTPVAFRKEPQQQVALERRREKPVLGIVEGHVDAVGLIPQPGVAVGVKELDLLARLVEGGGRASIGPAAQKAGPRLGPMAPALRAQNMLEAAPHQGMRINDP